jgi:DNA-binding MarR family transcriptional regulator
MDNQYKNLFINYSKCELKEAKIQSVKLEKMIAELFTNSDFEQLNDLLQSTRGMKQVGQQFLKTKDKNDYSEFCYVIGYVNALINITERLSDNYNRNNDIKNINTKHKDDIIRLLYKNKHFYHNELAEKVGISPSGLTAVIKKINQCRYPVIQVQKNSKFTLYSLTIDGYNYAKQLENK